LAVAQQEHDRLAAILRQAGAEVIYHDEAQPGRADAIFVFDPALITDRGAVILSMGKALRRGEEAAMARCFERLGIPIHYRLQGQALAEAGDMLWIDSDTLAVGLGFRTNAEAVRQLKEASLISIVDEKLAVIYPPLLSVPFWQYLQERGFHLIEVPPKEFDSMGPNVLALAPGQCLILEGNPITQRRLAAAGCEVITYQGNEISLKAEGGPTCLTRPILREV
jgi:N-dimethylarginine dimethylaminohydrolase